MSWLSPAALSVIWVRRKTNIGRMDQGIAPAHPCAKSPNSESIERTTVVARSRRGLR
jgi:hypothetical protein